MMITEEAMALATAARSPATGQGPFLQERAIAHPDWQGIRRFLLRVIGNEPSEDKSALFAELATLCPDDPDLFVNWGHCLEGLGHTDRAITIYREHLARHPAHLPVLFALEGLLQEQNASEEMITLYQNARVGNEDNLTFLVKFADLLLHYQYWQAAISAWQVVLANLPEDIPFHDVGAYWIGETYLLHSNALRHLGEAFVGAEQYDSAIDSLQKAVVRHPENVYAWYTLGTTFEKVGKQTQAIEAYQSVLRIFHRGDYLGKHDSSYWSKARDRIADLLERMGRYDETMIPEEDTVLWTWEGFLIRGEQENGLDYLKEQARTHPDWFNIRRAIVDYLKGVRAEESLATFEELAVLCPDDSWVFSEWVDTLRKTGKREEAIRAGQSYQTRHPTDIEIIFALGSMVSEDDAIQIYQNGLVDNKSNGLYLLNFALLLSQAERWEFAESMWRAFLRQVSAHSAFRGYTATAYRYLGEALSHQKKHSEAIEAFRKAVDIAPDAWTVWYQSGLLFEEANRTPEAMDAYRNVLRIFHKGNLSYDDYNVSAWSDACQRLGTLLERTGASENAKPYFGQALRLR